MLTKAQLFPNNEVAKRILYERAKQLATQNLAHPETKSLTSYIQFTLGAKERYGIPYGYAKEVLQQVQPTPLPRVRASIAGVINHRGALIAIIDLKAFFKVAPSESNSAPYIIIVEFNHITLGILADQVIGGRQYTQGSLDPAIPSLGITKPDYILGIQDGLITILNIEAIISDLQGG